MKKILKYLSLALITIGLASCFNITNNSIEDTSLIENQESGSATVSIFIPDYFKMSQETARAVAPQTTSVKLGYKVNGKFTYTAAVELSKATKKTMSDTAKTYLFGYQYELTFESIPLGTYAKGDLNIQLLDATGNVLSEGTNSATVTINKATGNKGTFYTIPTSSSAMEGSLAAGEMKFAKINLAAYVPYTLKLEIGANDTSYPDLVFFSSEGIYTEYKSITTAEQATITIAALTAAKTYYVGIYADNNKAVSSYKLTLTGTGALTLAENFEGETLNSLLSIKGSYAGVYARDEMLESYKQYGDALVDNHKKVLRLYANCAQKNTTSSLLIKGLSLKAESALSFDIRMDLWTSQNFSVLVNDVAYDIYLDGKNSGKSITSYRQTWQKASVILPAGDYSIELRTTPGGSYSPGLKNAVYIDNLTLADNTTATVDLSPKGKQETYVGGFNIPFTAKALRADGSVIPGKTVTWEGATNGTFTPGTSAATSTVTAIIDGKSASNNVIVHSADYLAEPVTINGNKYKGFVSAQDSNQELTNTTNITWTSPTPAKTTFRADGFFVLAGTANNVDLYVTVEKGTQKTYYFINRGTFKQRIWLRFGKGNYTVTICEAQVSSNTPGNSYVGDNKSWSFSTSSAYARVLSIYNENNSVSDDDAAYLLPSAWCQSDDLRISNVVNNIVAGLPSDATEGQKLAALHDWEIHKLYYDYDSLTSGKRKIQDASHVLEYGMGVCEGYANLFTAMERLIGVKGTIICANYNNHAWNNTYYKNNWLLVDTTWDDPSDSNNKTDAKPYSESYTYFLITAAQDKLTDTDHGNYAVHPGITATGIGGDGINDMRQIDTTEQPYVRGMPNGWY